MISFKTKANETTATGQSNRADTIRARVEQINTALAAIGYTVARRGQWRRGIVPMKNGHVTLPFPNEQGRGQS